MAEDRERFRDLLDRIGQPYAPSRDRRGATDADRRARRRTRRSPRSACRRSSGRRSRSAGPAAASSRPRTAYRERIRAGLRASPIGQVMVEQCLVGWQEIEYEVMRDADDTCIAVCSMENVDPLGVHTGDSIVVAPVQTLPDPVHQRLRSAALAIIRALGVEGGCNVQFALSPGLDRVRGHRGQPAGQPLVGAREQGDRLPDRPRRRPDRRRPAARRDPERRHRHDRRGVRAGPRLRRRQAAALPVRQVPDRRPDARQPDEGDRRGDGDRPDVRRGPEQGAPRPRAGRRRAAGRGPQLDAELRLPRRGLWRAADEDADDATRTPPTSRSAGSTRPARPASRPATPSEPPRRSSSRTSSRRPTRACGGSSACSGAASPSRRSRRRPASRRGSSPRWAATSPSRRTSGPRARRSRPPRRAGRRGGHAARDRQAGGLRRPGARRARRDPGTGPPRRARRARPPARLRDGRHVRRGVRRRDAVLLRDLRRGGLGAGGAAGRPSRGPRHRLGARSGSGRGSSSTTARCAPPRRSASVAGRR